MRARSSRSSVAPARRAALHVHGVPARPLAHPDPEALHRSVRQGEFPFLGLRKAWGFVSALDSRLYVSSAEAREGMWDGSLSYGGDNGGPLETMTNATLRGTPLSARSVHQQTDSSAQSLLSPASSLPRDRRQVLDWEGSVRSTAFASGGLLPEPDAARPRTDMRCSQTGG